MKYEMKKELIEEIVDIEDFVKGMLRSCNRGITALEKVTELKELKYEISRFKDLMRQEMNLIDLNFLVIEEIMEELK